MFEYSKVENVDVDGLTQAGLGLFSFPLCLAICLYISNYKIPQVDSKAYKEKKKGVQEAVAAVLASDSTCMYVYRYIASEKDPGGGDGLIVYIYIST